MEFRLWPLGLLPDVCCFAKKLHETQGSQSKFHELNIYIYIYIYLIYIYLLLLLYNSSNLDIEYSPYYIALGSTQIHKVIIVTTKTVIIYIYIYIYIYCHPQTDCFVLSELFSVARHAGRSMPGSKPIQLYVRLSLRPLGQQADHIG